MFKVSIISNILYIPPSFLAFHIPSIFALWQFMHVVSTNEIADILHFKVKMLYEHWKTCQTSENIQKWWTAKNKIVAYRKCRESCQKTFVTIYKCGSFFCQGMVRKQCDICNSLVIIYSSLINTLSFLTFYIKFLFQVPCNREKKKKKGIQKWRKFELLLSWYASLVHWLYFNHYIQYMVVFVVILTFICYFVYWTPILGRVL